MSLGVDGFELLVAELARLRRAISVVIDKPIELEINFLRDIFGVIKLLYASGAIAFPFAKAQATWVPLRRRETFARRFDYFGSPNCRPAFSAASLAALVRVCSTSGANQPVPM